MLRTGCLWFNLEVRLKLEEFPFGLPPPHLPRAK